LARGLPLDSVLVDGRYERAVGDSGFAVRDLSISSLTLNAGRSVACASG